MLFIRGGGLNWNFQIFKIFNFAIILEDRGSMLSMKFYHYQTISLHLQTTTIFIAAISLLTLIRELENFSQDHSPKNYSYDQVRIYTYADVDRSFLIEIATRCRRAFKRSVSGYLFARKIGGGFADGSRAECRAVPIAFTLLPSLYHVATQVSPLQNAATAELLMAFHILKPVST